jgi:hypothetical protein
MSTNVHTCPISILPSLHVVWAPQPRPAIPEGELEDFRVERNMKQSVFSGPMTLADTFSIQSRDFPRCRAPKNQIECCRNS